MYLGEDGKSLSCNPFTNTKLGKNVFKLFVINDSVTGPVKKIKPEIKE